MLTYKKNDIINIIIKITGEKPISIEDVGNHDVRRHHVYIVNFLDRKEVLKLYYKKLNCKVEIDALNIVRKFNVKSPIIIDSGVLDDGVDWLLSKYINGITLESIFHEISKEDKLEIFKIMGEELGKIHSIKFEKYTCWDIDRKKILEFDNYAEGFTYKVENIIETIKEKGLMESIPIEKAVQLLKDSYIKVREVHKINLTHNDFSGRNILVNFEDGHWQFEAVIDFENAMPGNSDEDIANLYQKYFNESEGLEKSFLSGYRKYLELSNKFYERKDIYLVYFGLNICSWAHDYIPHYYKENIELLSTII